MANDTDTVRGRVPVGDPVSTILLAFLGDNHAAFLASAVAAGPVPHATRYCSASSVVGLLLHARPCDSHGVPSP